MKRHLKSLLKNEHPEFLEFIIAVLYRLAHSDGIYSVAEDEDIREVAKIFDIKKNLFDYIISYFDKLISKIRNLFKPTKVISNA